MKWMISALAAVVLGVPTVFISGVVVSLSVAADQNPATVFVTLMGSAGDWVSGLGAFAAAAVAVYLAEKQRKEELPNLELSVSGSYLFSLVNHGRLPVQVSAQGLFVTSGFGSYMLGADATNGWRETANLGFGQSVGFKINREMIDFLAEWVVEQGGGKTGTLVLVVSTATREFRYPFPSYLLSHLKSAMKTVGK